VRIVWPNNLIVISSQATASFTERADLRLSAAVNPFWKPFEFASSEERVTIWHRIISFTLLKMEPDYTYGYWRWDQHNTWFSPSGIDIRVAKKTLTVSRELYVRC